MPTNYSDKQVKLQVAKLAAFIGERHRINLKRAAGHQKPWTRDPILLRYRFCNMYRELDTVTQWIRKEWREPHDGDQHLWFAMVVARYINLPATLAELKYPVPWEPKRWRAVAAQRQACKEKLFNGAYIINSTGPKVAHLENMFNNLWEHREQLYPRRGWTLRRFADGLMSMHGFAGFMTGQVVADLKYAQPLCLASDWHSFALSGPGSRRGLNRIVGRDIEANWKEAEWHDELMLLQRYVNRLLPADWEELHAQDLQNCLCEFDKYRRAQLGTGKPKQKYPGAK